MLLGISAAIMSKKVKATRTINPLHFEDLEPHRFEDLVRRLLYGFRDWSNIEATGRGGSDEGFDVRAWERDESLTNVGDEGEEGVRSVDGRLWQIQGKREKSITPTKMRSIIREGVDAKQPPHGYILAAATNITKKTYDVFRQELKRTGVRELYFWGKDYLDDQLALPQNDEILFTFFGISLSPRRRSRVSDIRFALNNKNKIQKLLFGSDSVRADIKPMAFFVRDINDTQYPDSAHYPDFDKHSRWFKRDAVHLGPHGLVFTIREGYAYLDRRNRAWDFTWAVDLTERNLNRHLEEDPKRKDAEKKLERFWRRLPLEHQAKLTAFGFLPFEDMLIIDDKGDSEYLQPHIFADFGPEGPFEYVFHNLRQGRELIHEKDFHEYSRKAMFPSVYPDYIKGAKHSLTSFDLPQPVAHQLRRLSSGAGTLYVFDNRMPGVSVGDIIASPPQDRQGFESHVEITHIRQFTVDEFLKEHETDAAFWQSRLKESAGRDIQGTDRFTVVEVFSVFLSPHGDPPQYFGRNDD